MSSKGNEKIELLKTVLEILGVKNQLSKERALGYALGLVDKKELRIEH